MTKQIPLETGIFSWPPDCPGHPYLIGSRCTNCGNHTFPAQSGCPKCAGAETEVVALSRRGTLWTWTVHAFVDDGVARHGTDQTLPLTK